MNTLRHPENSNDGSSKLQLPSRTRSSLSRSPHPYHRRGESLVTDSPPAKQAQANGQTRNATSRSESSESGTEADDERGPLLKGLPAPPIRARKGLRGSTPISQTPLVSPLPSPPPVVREDGDGFFDKKHHEAQQQQQEDPESRKKREAYLRCRRGEIVRRVTETLLIASIAWVVWTGAGGFQKLALWRREFVDWLRLALAIYLLYPLRLSYNAFKAGRPLTQSLRIGFHIPSKFDPGPLLYPLALPVMVAVSLHDRSSVYIPVNMVCGLSSLPQSVLAVWRDRGFLWYLRWFVTILPLHASGLPIAFTRSDSHPLDLTPDTRERISVEDLVVLFPLHEALTSVLEYLTTTSLDPSELQLLSTALISLLLFAQTPQAEILKALIWVGGLSVFITCRHLMIWEVALARIPSWKFARRRQIQGGIVQRIDHFICSFLSSRHNPRSSGDSSDSDDFVQVPKLNRRAATLRIQINDNVGSRFVAEAGPRSEEEQNGSLRCEQDDLGSLRRRNTFSILHHPNKRSAARRSKRRRRSSSNQSPLFASLSIEQAKARKYLYAAAVYTIVATIILIPIRHYVDSRALSAHEPFGWALGYLFGDIPDFRLQVVSNNLERWILLPQRPDDIPQQLKSVDDLRRYLIGAANTRLGLCAYCVVVLFTGILVVLQLTSVVEVDTRRKVFHGVMVAMLLPTIFVDPCFIALALALILAIFLLLDLFRASQLPPISRPLTNFLAPYVDGRDHRGPVIVSHIFLLIGCAIPLWLSLAGLPRAGTDPWQGWDVSTRDLSMVSGVICVGMGDAAASLIGRRFGKTKWYWGGGKSLEGSLAFAVAVTVGLMFSYSYLRLGRWDCWQEPNLMMALTKCWIAGCGASLLESTLTAANDNVVVPVGLWLLVRGLQI